MSINVMPKYGLRPFAPVKIEHLDPGPKRGTAEYSRVIRHRCGMKRIYNYKKLPAGRKTANA